MSTMPQRCILVAAFFASAAGAQPVDGVAGHFRPTEDAAAIQIEMGGGMVQVTPYGADGNAADSLVLVERQALDAFRAVFEIAGKTCSIVLDFSTTGVVHITPADDTAGIRVVAPIAVGVLPGKQLEDVLYRAEDYAEEPAVHLPGENWFAGLLAGNGAILACTWPATETTLSLRTGGNGGKAFTAVEIAPGSDGLYLGVLAAPAIWYRQELELNYLEKDVELPWIRPFAATYKTQLPMRAESTTPRSFESLNKRVEQFRPEIGSSIWPLWFEGETAFLRLGKRIPPRGELIVYPMKGGANTLMGFVERTPVARQIKDRNQRDPLPHGPRDAANVGFVACGGTGLIRGTLFAMGLQQRERVFLGEYADFLADYVAIVQQRNIAAFDFIAETQGKIETWLAASEAGSPAYVYYAAMAEAARAAEAGLRDKMDMYGGETPEDHIENAARAADRLKELLDTDSPEVFPECSELVYLCNRLAWGHAETAGMRFSMLARAWAQQAALGCADSPAVAGHAREIRSAIREALNGAPPW